MLDKDAKNLIPGRMIKLARIARGLSVHELGAAIGCAGATISNFERGKAQPHLDQYANIQAVLGYDFESPKAKAAFSFFLNGTT